VLQVGFGSWCAAALGMDWMDIILGWSVCLGLALVVNVAWLVNETESENHKLHEANPPVTHEESGAPDFRHGLQASEQV
jgi:hypothetical protein